MHPGRRRRSGLVAPREQGMRCDAGWAVPVFTSCPGNVVNCWYQLGHHFRARMAPPPYDARIHAWKPD